MQTTSLSRSPAPAHAGSGTQPARADGRYRAAFVRPVQVGGNLLDQAILAKCLAHVRYNARLTSRPPLRSHITGAGVRYRSPSALWTGSVLGGPSKGLEISNPSTSFGRRFSSLFAGRLCG